MFIGFRDISKAFPQDLPPCYTFTSTLGHELDNMIKMAEKDALHMALYANTIIYHYRVTPFGLINIGVTYQRLVNKLSVDI